VIHIQFNSLAFQIDGATLLLWVVVGIVAGFLASRAMLGHGLGLVGDLVVGIIGAFLGGFVANLLGFRVTVTVLPIVGSIVVAFMGAIILLLLLRLLGLGRGHRAGR